MKLRTNAEYKIFVEEIKQRVRDSQYAAFRAVNKELVALYWDIGKRIVDKQNNLGWGKAVVENLAIDLQKEFPGIRGFSADNLWRMRKFYVQFAKNSKLAPLVQEISWAKIIVIMESCKNDEEREFYIRMTKKFGWTKDVLIHQIENQSYEKTLLNQTSFDKTVPAKIRNQAKLAVRLSRMNIRSISLNLEMNTWKTNLSGSLWQMSGGFCWRWADTFVLSLISTE